MTISQLLNLQSNLLFGDIKSKTKYLPLVIYKIVNHLKKEIEIERIKPQAVIVAFYDLDNPIYFEKKWIEIRPQLKDLKVI